MYQDVEWSYPIGSVVRFSGEEYAVIAHGVQWNPRAEALEPVYQITQQFTKPNPQNGGWVTQDNLEPMEA